MKGFSIVEVIIALFITGIMVLVIANIPQAIRLITSSQSDSKVREAAAKKIEDLRIAGYDNLANGTTTISDPRLKSLASVNTSTVIADCPLALCPGGELVKQVSVTISWNENSNSKNFKLTTLIAKGGLK